MTTTNEQVLVLRHSDGVDSGWLGVALDLARVPVVTICLDAGDPLPDSIDWKGVVVLGGSMGAYEEADYPFFVAEKRFLARIVEADVPVLGICLGSQLLADATGGRAYQASDPEAGFMAMTVTEAGLADPVFKHLPDRVLVTHGDTFELPPGAELLAYTDRYQHAYRVGSALAVQFHTEAGADLVELAVSRPGGGNIVAAGLNPVDLVAELRAAEDAYKEQALRFFGAWVDSL